MGATNVAGNGARCRSCRKFVNRFFYLSDGAGAAEILPPATTEMKESVRRFAERNAGFLEEMKLLGD